ncbi:MAG: hypothetical protein KDD63_10650 [Bacteroidetes bacterium]|nr:hypothetical protein [Bacteroidota bacterium]
MNPPPSSSSNYQQIVDQINDRLPVHAMWDGFYIYKFKRSNLLISASQDHIYYRIFDLVFLKVIFFFFFSFWRDTNVVGDDLLRLSDREEFAQHHPNFDPQDRQIFAIDLHYSYQDEYQKHTFFVVAEKVFLFKCEPPNDGPGIDYEDPMGKVGFLCKENRVR